MDIVLHMANVTSFHPDVFLLIGIPGLEKSHLLLSILFCIMYILALAGNAILIAVILANESLHQPMYIFLVVLAIDDLLLSTSTVPKTLSIFWFSAHEISFNACLTQIFFIHYSSLIESGILLVMAYDRYVAICHPLEYVTKLTVSFIRTVIVISVIRGILVVGTIIFLAWRLPYKGSIVIEHTYCEHMSMARLATASILPNVIYGMAILSVTSVIDILLIGVSYVSIIQAVVRLSNSEAKYKAFNTCGSHLCVLALFFIPGYFSFITHRVPHNHIPPYVHILVANLYVIVPPMMNPIIYGVRTKEIQQKTFRMLTGNFSTQIPTL